MEYPGLLIQYAQSLYMEIDMQEEDHEKTMADIEGVPASHQEVRKDHSRDVKCAWHY